MMQTILPEYFERIVDSVQFNHPMQFLGSIDPHFSTYHPGRPAEFQNKIAVSAALMNVDGFISYCQSILEGEVKGDKQRAACILYGITSEILSAGYDPDGIARICKDILKESARKDPQANGWLEKVL